LCEGLSFIMKWINDIFSSTKTYYSVVNNVQQNNIAESQVTVKEEKQLTQRDIELIIDKLARENIPFDNNISNDLSVFDPLFEESARLIVIHQQGSTSLIQRKFSIGYNRAGMIMDQLEFAGIVGPIQGSKPREVYIREEYRLDQILLSLKDGNYTLFLPYTNDEIKKVKSQYINEIEKKHRDLINEIEFQKEQERLKILEFEKQKIREELLEDERKKQLKRLVKKELIESGHIQRETKRVPIPQDIQDRVWVRDGGKCVICGRTENLEFDHIIPFSKGGANTYRNLQLLCEKCNREKSNNIG